MGKNYIDNVENHKTQLEKYNWQNAFNHNS
jgi:hypothetical protein